MATDAQLQADTLLREILATQPNLLQGVTLASNGGKDVAEFIEALRIGLTAMYTKTPS